MLKKKILTQPLCFLPAAVLRISVVSLLAEDMLSFGKMNTIGHPLPVHNAGSLTTTIQKNSVKWLEAGAAFNEKKINFLYIF